MYEENQSFVPESFLSLYVKPGQYKPSLPRNELTQRYEFCEDMANMLVDTVSTQQFQLGITENNPTADGRKRRRRTINLFNLNRFDTLDTAHA